MRQAILAVFSTSYLAISIRRLDVLNVGRPAVALCGATLCVALGAWAGAPFLGVEEALRAVELHTLVLLLGMMVVAAGLREAGFFGWAATWVQEHVRSRVGLLWAVTLGCGLLSALVVNDAVCLLATPLVIGLAKAVRAPQRPFLFAVAMGSNAGSALTLAGNPQNMLVARLSGLSYRGYLGTTGLAALTGLAITGAVLHWFFRKELLQTTALPESNISGQADRRLMAITLGALALSVVANLLGVSLSLSALAAGSAVLLAAGARAARLLERVDWSVLLFFSALFVLVAALQHTGYPAAWVDEASRVLGHGPLALTLVLSIGSQIVSNVPLILVLEPWIRSFADANQAWAMTALVSTLAGNLTLLGSVANIIVVEQAETRVGFFEYLKVGLPVTMLSTAGAVAVFLAR